MNKFRDPAVYALHAGDHRYFYVGSTSMNSKTRLWEHISRARSGHMAPVYQKMRDVGISNVCVQDLAKERDRELRNGMEICAIVQLLEEGFSLTNKIWSRGGGLEVNSNEYRTIVRRAYRAANPLPPRVRKPRTRNLNPTKPRRPAKPREPRVPNHGTRTEWELHKCKCDPCRLAGAQRNARKRGQPIPTIAPTRGMIPDHGTANRYKHYDCRCESCRSASASRRSASRAERALRK